MSKGYGTWVWPAWQRRCSGECNCCLLLLKGRLQRRQSVSSLRLLWKDEAINTSCSDRIWCCDNVVMHDVRPCRGRRRFNSKKKTERKNVVTHCTQTFIPISTKKHVLTSSASNHLCPSCLSRIPCNATEDKGCHLLNVSILSHVCESPGFTHWPFVSQPGCPVMVHGDVLAPCWLVLLGATSMHHLCSPSPAVCSFWCVHAKHPHSHQPEHFCALHSKGNFFHYESG